MNPRSINQALWGLAALLAAAAVAVLVLGTLLPLEAGRSSARVDASDAPTSGAASLPKLSALEPVWNLRLRGELSAPSTAPAEPTRLAAATVAPDAGGIPVTLVGTIGNSLAMLQDDSGEIEVRAVGESMAGIEVLEIRPARVEVRYNGRTVTLHKPVETEAESAR